MQNFGDHRQRSDRALPHAGAKQQFRKVAWATLRRRGQIAVQTSHHYIARSHLVMTGHCQMRQERLLGWVSLDRLSRRTLKPRKFVHNLRRPQEPQRFDLSASRPLRATIREIDDLALTKPIDGSMRFFDKANHSL